MAENAFEREPQLYGAAPCGLEAPAPSREGRYLGSVRFFKHLILTVLALLILIPTILSIMFGVSLVQTRRALDDLQLRINQLQSSVSQAESPPGKNEEPPHAQALPPESSKPDESSAPELPAYQSLYPDLYAQPVERNRIDVAKVVYLTFDDGPSERTPELLEVLDCYDVKATFFVVGGESDICRQWMRDIVEAGHTIGVHSYTHCYTDIYDSVEAYLEDFAREYYLILDATGVAPQIFRFPGGSVNAYNGHIYQEIISEMTRRGFVYFDWNRQTGDAVRSSVPARKLVENALDRAASMRRVFLLAHDNTRFTNVVEALPKIIEGYQAEGFSFAALTPEVKPVIYHYPA